MKKARMETAATTGEGLTVGIPGHGSFTVTEEALRMITVFGGQLHCYQADGGCRKQGLYFSRTVPKKALQCLVSGPRPGTTSPDGATGQDSEEVMISVSRELAPKLDGAVLEFGSYNKMQRFLWLATPAVKGPACTCRRSVGSPAGKTLLVLTTRGSD